MKRLFSSNSEPEIVLLKGLLESNGIEVLIVAEGVGNYMRTLGADFNLFKDLKVREADFEKAVSIMKENGYEILEDSPVTLVAETPNSVKWIVRIAAIVGLLILFSKLALGFYYG